MATDDESATEMRIILLNHYLPMVTFSIYRLFNFVAFLKMFILSRLHEEEFKLFRLGGHLSEEFKMFFYSSRCAVVENL